MRSSKSSLRAVARSDVSDRVISVFMDCRREGRERKAARDERGTEDR